MRKSVIFTTIFFCAGPRAQAQVFQRRGLANAPRAAVSEKLSKKFGVHSNDGEYSALELETVPLVKAKNTVSAKALAVQIFQSFGSGDEPRTKRDSNRGAVSVDSGEWKISVDSSGFSGSIKRKLDAVTSFIPDLDPIKTVLMLKSAHNFLENHLPLFSERNPREDIHLWRVGHADNEHLGSKGETVKETTIESYVLLSRSVDKY